ncbi:cytochrome P450 family protein [Rhodobacteraceae bacterium HTCC2150]|nr:cytochrome P450 family protein [Rhodobacteraceae bacterium HTCC2150]
MIIAPKPRPRADKVSLFKYLRLFRADILSAQPARLYRAWMAEFKTPLFSSYMINQPELLDLVLKERPKEFPKSDRIGAGLRPLLGNSVFLTNGETWERQRRIIDPAFEGGRLRDTFTAISAAADAAVLRMRDQASGQPVDIEPETSHAAADVIFRTLFSIPIENTTAQSVFTEFQAYQRSQPILNLAAFLPGPRWMPKFFRKSTKKSAARIRKLILELTKSRLADINAGTAPNDLATKIMTTKDPVTGQTFDLDEMVDQVAIFFLAGHETSASALAWALYLLAMDQEAQTRAATEAQELLANGPLQFSDLSKLKYTRDVFRETLRLFPPVPMMVRENQEEQIFRERKIKKGAQIVLSPWHLQRHERLWENPDAFDPDRWSAPEGKESQRNAYMPFSAGPRVCTGAGFAMIEGVVLLGKILAEYQFEIVREKPAVPIAHLTVRGRDGIWLKINSRQKHSE